MSDAEALTVVVYARTSRDEVEGQDIGAQAEQVRRDALEQGMEVLPDSCMDEGVSGSVGPMDRKGFLQALQQVRDGNADAIALRDVSRLDRRHPFLAGADYVALLQEGIGFVFTRGRALPSNPNLEDWTLGDTILATVDLGESQSYLAAVRKNTQHKMDDLKRPGAKTKSGKPVGRPTKVTDAEVEWAYARSQEIGVSAAARELSVRRGVNDVLDPKTVKKRKVGHSTLLAAFERLGYDWPVKNPNPSETVSDKGLGDSVRNGSVSDKGVVPE